MAIKKEKKDMFLDRFQKVFIMGLKSQQAIQQALLDVFADYGLRRRDHGAGADTASLSSIISFMMNSAPENVQTKAICSYVEHVAMFRIDRKSWMCSPLKKQEYDVAWLNTLKTTTWYDHASSLVEWKSPKVSYSGLATTLAKQAVLDSQEPNWNDVLDEIKRAFSNAKNGRSVKDWVETGLEKGNLVQVDGRIKAA